MFNRTPEGLKLSADGQVVLVQAEQVEGRIDDIERALLAAINGCKATFGSRSRSRSGPVS